ncbi:DUF3445 domain-containing protein [Aquamicrobium sp. LC103]|uniref:heme-dependent oxidative N-demethylase family protein n=1 Tax=Aquamicrobium sp. LC103 TaxID=1120658 RepID=UPI00063E7636|nr:DUF3445 domain-containing protein [Aquamicrobium sp. LC103]TKT77531.1 DUF3445 domain-containing protein [Aquamicrobium sp. LC103]
MPAYTPYDGSTKPFTIGLKPLALPGWIEIDRHFDAYLAEKKRLYASIPDKVFVAEEDTRDAQAEVLGLVEDHLLDHHGPDYRRTDGGVERLGSDPTDADASPLVRASLLIQEDLIVMRKGEDGWRLAAGSLCFPSSWSLREKFGRPLQDIHDPVPDFGPGTRMATLIDRMFDNLQAAQPVERFNWSIQANPDLYHPLSENQRIDRASARSARFANEKLAANAFIRVERQTLRKLPLSRDILFTIRIYLDPLEVLARDPDAARLAGSFAGQLNALDEAQLDYKGLTADRDRLVAALERIAKAG